MYTLSNDKLTVEILDPIADRSRMGARYCCGGYIFQIHDRQLGPLLSGPSYPNAFNSFDGQGIPDAFNLAPLRSVGDADSGLILGVGMCHLRPDYRQNEVTDYAAWDVSQGDVSLVMRTTQHHVGWSLILTREVSLLNRTVRSKTRISNQGDAAIPICWFPHPFFPQPLEPTLLKLNFSTKIADNDGYLQSDSGYIMRKGAPVMPGHYLALTHASQVPLVVQQRHPVLGMVTATTSYVPSFFPIWGNANTFSWEPFLERTIAPGQEPEWSIDYDF